jgi:SAM-dependent methyltransferase
MSPAAVGGGAMHPIGWVPAGAGALLDVGCNVGEFLGHCREAHPGLLLAGVEVNAGALAAARRLVPGAVLCRAGAEALPFAAGAFGCVTCIEVLEHVPAGRRAAALAEMRRVLRPGGRLVLRVPHAGLFAGLDPNNARFRAPRLYRALVGRGLRDDGYAGGAAAVVWHHHFTAAELLRLAGPGWEAEATRTGGCLLMPLADAARWPLLRLGRHRGPLLRALNALFAWDLARDYGRASYDILLVLRRAPGAAAGCRGPREARP